MLPVLLAFLFLASDAAVRGSFSEHCVPGIVDQGRASFGKMSLDDCQWKAWYNSYTYVFGNGPAARGWCYLYHLKIGPNDLDLVAHTTLSKRDWETCTVTAVLAKPRAAVETAVGDACADKTNIFGSSTCNANTDCSYGTYLKFCAKTCCEKTQPETGGCGYDTCESCVSLLNSNNHRQCDWVKGACTAVADGTSWRQLDVTASYNCPEARSEIQVAGGRCEGLSCTGCLLYEPADGESYCAFVAGECMLASRMPMDTTDAVWDTSSCPSHAETAVAWGGRCTQSEINRGCYKHFYDCICPDVETEEELAASKKVAKMSAMSAGSRSTASYTRRSGPPSKQMGRRYSEEELAASKKVAKMSAMSAGSRSTASYTRRSGPPSKQMGRRYSEEEVAASKKVAKMAAMSAGSRSTASYTRRSGPPSKQMGRRYSEEAVGDCYKHCMGKYQDEEHCSISCKADAETAVAWGGRCTQSEINRGCYKHFYDCICPDVETEIAMADSTSGSVTVDEVALYLMAAVGLGSLVYGARMHFSKQRGSTVDIEI